MVFRASALEQAVDLGIALCAGELVKCSLMPWAIVANRALPLAVGAHPRELPRRGVLYGDFWESYQKVLPDDDRHRAVGKSEGQTGHHVERWNCTLRQRLGRFVRKTLSFSKSEAMHEVCLLLLFLHDYNLSCLNNTG